MDAKLLKAKLIVMGEPSALIDDYLDDAKYPSFDGYWSYKESYDAQIRWDALHRQNSPVGGRSIDGSGIAGLMANLKAAELQ